MIAKNIKIVLFILISALRLSAQTERFDDRVLLKSGSLIYGKIVQFSTSDTLKIKLENGQTISFDPKNIESVRFAKPPKVKKAKIDTDFVYNAREKGLYHATSFGLSFGKSSILGNRQTRVGISINHASGYQFCHFLGIGGGVNYDEYYLSGGESSSLAAFGEVRSYFLKKNTTPYVSFAVGYGQPIRNKGEVFSDYRGGLMLNPTVGLRFGNKPKVKFFVDLSFKNQKVGYINQWDASGDFIDRYTVQYRRWILRGGILF